MDFYEITLKEAPKTEFVYNVEKSNYSNRFPSTPDLLEIGLCLQGNIIVLYNDGTKRTEEPGMTMIVTNSTSCRTYAEKAGIQRHITFGVTVKHSEKLISDKALTFAELKSTEERVLSGESILIPHLVPLEGEASAVEDIISRGLTFFYSADPADRLRCVSVWYELCAYLTRFSLKKLRQLFFENLPSDEKYVEAAVHYISEHLSENIRLESISQAVGISTGYLQSLFKKITGLTVIEYINREKVELVKGYTAGNRMTLSAAARLVGIEDEAYMSRLFKKVTDISFAQYQAANSKKIRE